MSAYNFIGGPADGHILVVPAGVTTWSAYGPDGAETVYHLLPDGLAVPRDAVRVEARAPVDERDDHLTLEDRIGWAIRQASTMLLNEQRPHPLSIRISVERTEFMGSERLVARATGWEV